MGGSISISANQISAVEAAVATQTGCKGIAQEMQYMVKKGNAPLEVVQQMKDLESKIALTNLSEISKRPYVDCMIICSYDQESGRVFPVQRDDPEKQLVIRVCKENNLRTNEDCSLHIFLKRDSNYLRCETASLSSNEIMNLANSIYNLDAVITFNPVSPPKYTLQIKTGGGYFIDLYSCKYETKDPRDNKKIDPTNTLSQNICAGCHLKPNVTDEERERGDIMIAKYLYKYCPDSGAICREQCLVCGKTGVDQPTALPVNKGDHIDLSDDSAKIRKIFEGDYHEEKNGKYEYYSFKCGDDFNTDTIENMDNNEITFSDYFKLININENDNSGFSAIETYFKIDSLIKYDNIIELNGNSRNGGNSSGHKLMYNSDSGLKEIIIGDGSSIRGEASGAMNEEDIANLSDSLNVNIILFDYADGEITVRDIQIKPNKPFIFLVREKRELPGHDESKAGDDDPPDDYEYFYNLLIPKSQKVNNQFCVDAWETDSLFDIGQLHPEDAIKRGKREKAATTLQAAIRGSKARKSYLEQKQAATALQAAFRGHKTRTTIFFTDSEIDHIALQISSTPHGVDYNTVLQNFASYYERVEGNDKNRLETILGKHTDADFNPESGCDRIIKSNIGVGTGTDGNYNNDNIKTLLRKLQIDDRFKTCGEAYNAATQIQKIARGRANRKKVQQIKDDAIIDDIATEIETTINENPLPWKMETIKNQIINYFNKIYPSVNRPRGKRKISEDEKKLFTPDGILSKNRLKEKGLKKKKKKNSFCRTALNNVYKTYRDYYPDQPANIEAIKGILKALSKYKPFLNCNPSPSTASAPPRTQTQGRRRRRRRGGFLSHHNQIEFAKYNVAVTKEVLRRAKIRLSQAKRLKKDTALLKKRVSLAQKAHDQTLSELKMFSSD